MVQLIYMIVFGLQIWGLSEREPCYRHTIMAITLGYCDWLILLLLWGGATKFDWRPTPAAGHRARRHCTFLTG